MLTVRIIYPELGIIIGLVITIIFGFGVGCFVGYVGKKKEPLPSPNDIISHEWDRLTRQEMGGFWVGFIERLIFFAALWISGAWPILSSWLVFKLAFYWQSTNFSTFPEKSPNPKEAKYLVAKRELGTHQVATALIGTGANIVLAMFGVAIGKCIVNN
jgi:hypothetical protein